MKFEEEFIGFFNVQCFSSCIWLAVSSSSLLYIVYTTCMYVYIMYLYTRPDERIRAYNNNLLDL